MGKLLSTIIVIIGLVVAFATSAKAETTECMEIVSLPAVITVQGVYCLKQNLTTAMTSGHAIEIQTNNVTIDLNSWKLGGAAGGAGTFASGIFALDRKNITIRNGTIRGFWRGIYLLGSTGSGHLVEYIRADASRFVGMEVEGNNNIVRNNHIINTGDNSNVNYALGILVTKGGNHVISDNVVDGVSETLQATGISVNETSNVEVSGNSIFGLNTATDRWAITLGQVTNAVIINNQIINSGGGTSAIIDASSSTGLDCIENTIRGYTTGQSGCDYTSGNHIN